MKPKNPYRKNAKLTRQKSIKIIELFSEDFDAYETFKILKGSINYRTIKDWYNYFRENIYKYSIKEKQKKTGGVFELDETYCGPKKIKGKRGRGAGDKIKVFGLLKRDNQVYTEIVPNCEAKTLIPIIRGKIDIENSIINSDGWTAYDGLVDLGYKKDYRVIHSKNEFARGTQHINGIESFWSFMKRRMNKFNGIKKDKFILHLKESEFRFNCRLQNKNIKEELIKILKKNTKEIKKDEKS